MTAVTGFVGSFLVDRLLQDGWNVVANKERVRDLYVSWQRERQEARRQQPDYLGAT